MRVGGLGLSRDDWDVHVGPRHRQIGDFLAVIREIRGIFAAPGGLARLFGLDLSPDVSRIVPRSGVWVRRIIYDTMAVILGLC